MMHGQKNIKKFHALLLQYRLCYVKVFFV